MSTIRTARVPTTHASRYLQQLCKHWSHKYHTEFDASRGFIDMSLGRAELVAEPDALAVTLNVNDPEQAERMQHVVATHLDRFAFREAPLPFDWR